MDNINLSEICYPLEYKLSVLIEAYNVYGTKGSGVKKSDIQFIKDRIDRIITAHDAFLKIIDQMTDEVNKHVKSLS